MSSEPQYMAEHLRSGLATDSRVHELGLDVSVIGTTVVVRGAVSSVAQRDAVGMIASELAPGAEIVNDVEVVPSRQPDSAEAEELG
ncbi:MAG: BON domain-containing protein [Acidimicrobiales bacterium]